MQLSQHILCLVGRDEERFTIIQKMFGIKLKYLHLAMLSCMNVTNYHSTQYSAFMTLDCTGCTLLSYLLYFTFTALGDILECGVAAYHYTTFILISWVDVCGLIDILHQGFSAMQKQMHQQAHYQAVDVEAVNKHIA